MTLVRAVAKAAREDVDDVTVAGERARRGGQRPREPLPVGEPPRPGPRTLDEVGGASTRVDIDDPVRLRRKRRSRGVRSAQPRPARPSTPGDEGLQVDLVVDALDGEIEQVLRPTPPRRCRRSSCSRRRR
jgi:hypothetical protein